MGMWHVIESKNPDGDLFKCECGSDKFAYVGGCGDSGGMDAAGDCIKCGKCTLACPTKIAELRH